MSRDIREIISEANKIWEESDPNNLTEAIREIINNRISPDVGKTLLSCVQNGDRIQCKFSSPDQSFVQDLGKALEDSNLLASGWSIVGNVSGGQFSVTFGSPKSLTSEGYIQEGVIGDTKDAIIRAWVRLWINVNPDMVATKIDYQRAGTSRNSFLKQGNEDSKEELINIIVDRYLGEYNKKSPWENY